MWELIPPTDRFLNAEERKQVTALFDAILPGDDDMPGATDADAAEYIDRLLAMDESYYYEIRGWKKKYREGLPALNSASRAMFGGRDAAQLSRDEVTKLLEALSKASLQGVPAGFDQKGFFALLRSHCIEACFADPRWGGNRDSIFWRWYGYLEIPRSFKRDPQTGELKEAKPDAI